MRSWESSGPTIESGVGTLLPRTQAFSEIEPEAVEWLSPGRLAIGKITILEGDPGLGKSTITLDWAARLSRGLALPGGEPLGKPRGTLILSAEDGKGDTIRPRLDAAGADVGLVRRFFLVDQDENEYLPSIPLSLDAMANMVDATNAVMVVIDPLPAFLSGDVKGNSDQDVRRALTPLTTMAERHGVAIVVLRHLNKAIGMASMYRGAGSIGIIGAARFALLVAKDPDDETGQKRILASQKCNIGPEPPSLSYRLESVADTDVARLVWTGESHHQASGLTSGPRTDDERAVSEEAKDWLLALLKDGPVKSKDIERQAKEAGISFRACQAIKRRLGIQSGRLGDTTSGPYSWWMPAVTVRAERPNDPARTPGPRLVRAEENGISMLDSVVRAGYQGDPFSEEDDE